MQIIRNLNDIQHLKASGLITEALAKHWTRKILALRLALEPETGVEDFSLTTCGSFGVLEKGDNCLSAIGLPDSLAEIMPEWISRLEVSGEVYYVLYIMPGNDRVVQLYLPDEILEETLRLWLSEQPMEEEAGCDYDKF